MQPAIAIVGAGPRGISIIERVAATLNESNSNQPLTIHLIDDAQHGAGRVWDTAQTHTLCMNTLAGAVTLFTEPGATVTAPVLEGPTMYEWIQLLRGERDTISATKQSLFDAHPTPNHVTADFGTELAATRPESNPSRALYGEYLHWVLTVALTQLPEHVTVTNHRSRAQRITAENGRDAITLEDGTTVHADATVLATGWVVPEHPVAFRGHWIQPGNPVEQDVDTLVAGETAIVRGLGMGFFDLMALSTINRGGRFVPADTRSGLRYEPSGAEPHLVVTSGRGYSYLPKSEYHSLPPKADLSRLRAAIEHHSGATTVSFGEQLWPALIRDSYAAYYTTLARVRPDALHIPLADIISRIDAAPLAGAATRTSLLPCTRALNDALADATTEPFDISYWIDPLAGCDGLDAESLNWVIADALARDIAEAVAAHDSPIKSALWVISAGRKPTAIAVENGRGTPEDQRGALSDYMAFGQMVGSGPPLFRSRELLALIDAGLVTLLGPAPTVTQSGTTFTATSAERTVTADTLADAFLPSPNITRAADPLTASLLESERIRPFAPFGTPTGSPETDADTRRTVHPDGTLDPRLHIAGIPTGKQWADTTISPMPGTDPRMLQETDLTAQSLLRQAGVR